MVDLLDTPAEDDELEDGKGLAARPEPIDETPRQEPKLSELEAFAITQALAAQATVEWLMASDEHGRDLLTFSDLLRRPAWHRRSACRGVGTEGYIIKNGGRHNRELCADCPVRQECLEAALADPELVGLWGGTTDRERREMRRGSAAVAR